MTARDEAIEAATKAIGAVMRIRITAESERDELRAANHAMIRIIREHGDVEAERDAAVAENARLLARIAAVEAAGPKLAALSKWVDEAPMNAARDPEARLWGRVAKVGEECGEVIAALIGATGQNPRKGVHGCVDDVVKELLDVAVTALAAVEHISGNDGGSLDMLADHIDFLCDRAGLAVLAASPTPTGPEPCEHGETKAHDVYYTIGRERDWAGACPGPATPTEPTEETP